MKKYIVSFVALLTLGYAGYAYCQANEGAGPNNKREIAGAPGYLPYKEYQLARWGEANPAISVPLSAGDVVIRDTVSDDGVTIGLVGIAGSTDAIAGVVVGGNIMTAETAGLTASQDYGRRNWGWIQVKGYNSVTNITGGGGAGTALIASSVARYATGTNPSLVSGGSATMPPRIMGFSYDAASQGRSEAEIDL